MKWSKKGYSRRRNKKHFLSEMEVNEECVSSFLNDLEDFVDFSRVPDQELANQSDQGVIQTLYTFANNTIYGETRNILAMSRCHSLEIIDPQSTTD